MVYIGVAFTGNKLPVTSLLNPLIWLVRDNALCLQDQIQVQCILTYLLCTEVSSFLIVH